MYAWLPPVSCMANKPALFAPDYDRERGIFTERDRRFLAGELDEELTDNQRRQKRYRLRRRLYNAIQDLAYLQHFDTEDIGLLAGEMSHVLGEGKYELPPGTTPPEPDVEVSERLRAGTQELVAFWREIYGEDVLRYLLSESIHVDRVLEHYQETGRFALVDVNVDVETHGDISIEKLQRIVWGREPLENLPTDDRAVLAPSAEVVEFAGEAGPTPPGERTDDGYIAKHPDLADTVAEVIDSYFEDLYPDQAPQIYDVVEQVAEQENVGFEMAHEAFVDLISRGGYAVAAGTTVPVFDSPPER